MTSNFSAGEKMYALHCVQNNFRVDGRQRNDYRPMELETNFLPQAMSSVRLRLANTDVIVGIKNDIDTPSLEKPNEGKLDFYVDCSANATPSFEGRGGEHLANEIVTSLTNAYSSARAFNLTSLCIIKGHACWKISVDILILECGGNLFDTVSLAVKAALFANEIPSLKYAHMDGKNFEFDVVEEADEYRNLDVTYAPIMITLCKIGEFCVVDPSVIEEQCSSASIVIAVSGDKFTAVLKQGSGSIHPATFTESLRFGLNVAQSLDKALMEALDREKSVNKRKIVGLL